MFGNDGKQSKCSKLVKKSSELSKNVLKWLKITQDVPKCPLQTHYCPNGLAFLSKTHEKSNANYSRIHTKLKKQWWCTGRQTDGLTNKQLKILGTASLCRGKETSSVRDKLACRKTSLFRQRCVWIRHFGKFWDIWGHLGKTRNTLWRVWSNNTGFPVFSYHFQP